ncbi:MAG: DNA replication/repair protein RecF [Bacteroidales bacterium]|nr:DNA replication/repair protein RecF [Candidatus Colimorpha onthohippi]
MHLENIKLSNFKNYSNLELDLCDNVNCFVGNNGAGKTNLLDAVYYLSFCKSYFTTIDTQNIRFEEPFFAIHGRYQHQDNGFTVSCIQKRGAAKQVKLDRKCYQTLSDHIGKIPLVIITPSDQSLILGGSELRRKFMDGVIAQTDKEFLTHLIQYQKSVDQRNKLLKQFYEDRQFDSAALQLWDDQLAIHGAVVHEARCRFVEGFIPIFQYYFEQIAGSSELPLLQFNSSLLSFGNPSDSAETRLRMQLLESRNHDKCVLYTTVGPHKDDLDFLIDNFMVRRFSSQGQQKTYLLALKLAQFEYIFNIGKIKPILLLDDVFDKLDMPRVKQLIHLVGSDRFGQVLLTDTQPGRVQAIFDEMPNIEHRIFEVSQGSVFLKS